MPKPISPDLRARIVDAYKSGEGTYEDLAARFNVGYATVSRMLRIHRERDDLAPLPPTGGPPPIITEDELPELRRMVEEAPDKTLVEFCDEWEVRTGARVSKATMGRTLKRAGMTWKRKRFRPSEQLRPDVEEKREKYTIEVAKKDPEKLIFLDESSCNITMSPMWDWGLKGSRVLDHKPVNRGKNVRTRPGPS